LNKLQLTQRLRQEAGIPGSGPTTTVGQQGELGRLVSWIEQAYEDLQDTRPDWEFLRSDFSFNCVVGTSTYAPSTVTDLANWKYDSLRVYMTDLDDEQWLIYKPWDLFRDTRLIGSTRTQTGRPIDFTIKPDKSLVLWPIPDDTYTIDGEFYKAAQTMDTDTDVPAFERHHMVIVWNALERYASYVGEPSLFAKAQKEYGRLLNKLTLDRTRNITVGCPLA
jgi:hypothetical protein